MGGVSVSRPLQRDEEAYCDGGFSAWCGKDLIVPLDRIDLDQMLPMLGGKYEPDNFRIYDVVTHFRVWGPIHEQLRDLPDGARLSS